MNIIIIEDEKPAARLLQRKLEKLGLQVHKLLHSVEESVEWFQNNNHPDLIFLDIQLSDGLSFEFFEQINIKRAVIFTTAFDKYALRTFKLNSIDYLLKPIDEDELEIAIKKLKNKQQKSTVSNLDFDMIKKMILETETKEYKSRFSIKIGQQIKVISIDDFECFYSEKKGTYLHTFKNRNYLLDSTLEQIEVELNPKKFYRINRKFIIPLKAINQIQGYSNSRLKVILPSYKDEEVIVSREKVSDFKTWID